MWKIPIETLSLPPCPYPSVRIGPGGRDSFFSYRGGSQRDRAFILFLSARPLCSGFGFILFLSEITLLAESRHPATTPDGDHRNCQSSVGQQRCVLRKGSPAGPAQSEKGQNQCVAGQKHSVFGQFQKHVFLRQSALQGTRRVKKDKNRVLQDKNIMCSENLQKHVFLHQSAPQGTRRKKKDKNNVLQDKNMVCSDNFKNM